MKSPFFRPLLTVAGTALLLTMTTGCDANDPNINDPVIGPEGRSSVAITGGFNSQFSGHSFFATAADGGDSSPGIGLALYRVAAQDTSFVFFVSDGSNTLPQQGTYPILFPDTTGTRPVDPTEFSALYVGASQSAASFAVGETGTLTITGTTNDQLTGTFSFEGEGFSTVGPTVTRIQGNGSFTATHATGTRLQELIELLGLDAFGDTDAVLNQANRLQEKSSLRTNTPSRG